MPDQMRSYLDFEKPVAELEAKVDELRALAASGSDIGDEIARIEDKAQQALADLYANLTPWQKTLVARHPQRPHFHRFRQRADDGIHADGRRPQIRRGRGAGGRLRPLPRRAICVIGQEKGATTDGRIKHNFGMARPKAIARRAADGDGRPLRHSGAVDRRFRRRLSRHRRRGARRGGSDRTLDRHLPLARRPNVAIITGEGMSGGAIAITTANRC
jgi:acetyl-CoA carboxylase carboxyl transferase subunit alpha